MFRIDRVRNLLVLGSILLGIICVAAWQVWTGNVQETRIENELFVWDHTSKVAWQNDGPFGPRTQKVELPKNLDWLNTKNPITMEDLKGKLVLLDFWTYCCINCMHILPVLDQAEKKYENELVVIGVHTAKFATERDTSNIREAILRYEIRHPVVNDSEHLLWNRLEVASWPTLILIDPEGYVIWGNSGEIPAEELNKVLDKATAFYRRKGELNRKPVRFDLVEYETEATPLKFPGKVLADAPSKRLFISDSNHNRIVISSFDGKLERIVGSGALGSDDGSFETATFDHPQGLAVKDDLLWIADTENHLIRLANLQTGKVTTVAGTGKQADNGFPGLTASSPIPRKYSRNPKSTIIASPWDLWIDQDSLYIAMAGPHQIWKMDLAGKSIAPYAGNGREDIVDGALMPTKPYALGSSSFAQPSGLAGDGKYLYVADSEGSSIRAVPLNSQGNVRTLIGTSGLSQNRLFTFGDKDGAPGTALLQHPLAVALYGRSVIVADTYNNKLKSVDLTSGTVSTLLGDASPGKTDSPPLFDEPSGLSIAGDLLFVADTNNHLVRKVNLKDNSVSTLEIAGLEPPKLDKPKELLTLPKNAVRKKLPVQQIAADAKSVTLQIDLQLPPGWKLNTLANFPVVAIHGEEKKLNLEVDLNAKETPLQIELPLGAKDQQKWEVAITYYYCQENGEGLCLADTVILECPINRSDKGEGNRVEYTYELDL